MKKTILTTTIAFLLGMGIQQNAHADLKDGLVAHWSFDDCRATDNSGNGHDGTLNGNPQCVDGVKGKAFSFDGSSYINVPNSESLNPKNQITISFWALANSEVKNAAGIIGKGAKGWDGCGGIREYAVWFSDGAGKSLFHITSGGDNSCQHNLNSEKINIGEWVYVTSVVDRINHVMSFYINGRLSTQQADSYSSFNDNGLDLRIANSYDETLPLFNGSLDDLRIYNRALTEAEVLELYNGGGVVAEKPVLVADTGTTGVCSATKTAAMQIGGSETVFSSSAAEVCNGNNVTETPRGTKLNTGIVVGKTEWISSNYNLQCVNNVNKQKITKSNYNSLTYDCKKLGLNIKQGDDLTVSIQQAKVGKDRIVNGHVIWAKIPYQVECVNTNTGKKVSFSSNNQNYDCEKQGLQVTAGQKVKVDVKGFVDDTEPMLQIRKWNELVNLAIPGDILLFNHEYECSGESCFFKSGAYALGDSYGFYSHAALVTGRDFKIKKINVFHAKGPAPYYKKVKDQIASDSYALDDLRSQYPRGSIALYRVKNFTDAIKRHELVADGIKKYDSYAYISLDNLLNGNLFLTTYCSALVRDIWAMQGIVLDEKDVDAGGVSTFVFTPDELRASDNLEPLGGIIF